MRFLLGVLVGYSMRGKKKLLITVLATIVFIVYIILPAVALLALRLDVQHERQSRPTQTRVPGEEELKREITDHRPRISERLPKIYSQGYPVTIEQDMKKKFLFKCQEFAEIDLVVFDKPNGDAAREEVREFIKFLKENDVDYTWQTKEKAPRTEASIVKL